MRRRSCVTAQALVAIALVASAGSPWADSVYKCTVDGKVTFQDRPCPEREQTVLCPDGKEKGNRDCQEQGGYGNASRGYALPGGGGNTSPAYASPGGSKSTPSTYHTPGTDVDVRGYYRKDGTYVQPHTRSAPRR